MKDYTKAFEALLSDLSYESRELYDYPRDLYEASHEHAANHGDVIYTAKAHENVRNASSEELAHAESQFEDCGGAPENGVNGASAYDSTAILLSYHLEEYRFRELVRGELETLKDEIDSLISELMAEQENCEDEGEKTRLYTFENELAEKMDEIDSILG